jgi:hypothetical protein
MVTEVVLTCLAVVLVGSAIVDRIRRRRRAWRADHDELTERDLRQAADSQEVASARDAEVNRLGAVEEATWSPNWPR